MNPPDFSANIERFTGFAEDYDRFRPVPWLWCCQVRVGIT